MLRESTEELLDWHNSSRAVSVCAVRDGTDLHSEVCHLGQQVLEQFSLCSGQVRGQHHPHVVPRRRRHHVGEHEHTCVTQQHWGLQGQEGVQPVAHLPPDQNRGMTKLSKQKVLCTAFVSLNTLQHFVAELAL